MVKWIKQPNKFSCGQTCVAMAAGVSVKKAIEVFGHNGPSRITDQVRAFRKLGGKAIGEDVAASKVRKVLRMAFLSTSYMKRDRRTKDGYSYTRTTGQHHAVLWFEGKFYDPWYGVSEKLKRGQKIRYVAEISPPRKKGKR